MIAACCCHQRSLVLTDIVWNLCLCLVLNLFTWTLGTQGLLMQHEDELSGPCSMYRAFQFAQVFFLIPKGKQNEKKNDSIVMR